MPSSELISLLRAKSNALDVSVRFLVLDLCDRLERKTRDCELLAQKIVELRRRSVKTNADRIRAMNDEELADYLAELGSEANNGIIYSDRPEEWLEWLQQPMEVQG